MRYQIPVQMTRVVGKLKHPGLLDKHQPTVFERTIILGSSTAAPASAVSLFSEDFEGYTSFPAHDPLFDPVNPGIPKISEGASEIWYGARFEQADDGSINQDLAVQKFGGGSNNSHVGRTEDDAGLLIKLDTTGMQNITLSFDWRTFSASTSDRFVVGYHAGAVNDFGTCTGQGEIGCFADLSGTLPWYTTQAGNPPVLTGNWEQLLRESKSNSWNSESFVLDTSAADQSEVWIAFWLDNGESDHAKIDNINVTGDLVVVPVPAALWLFGSGLTGLLAATRRRPRV